MKRKTGHKGFIMTAVFFLLVGSAWAQAGRGRGRLSGIVLDAFQNRIPSAKIVCEFMENEELKKETKANEKGEWAVLGLGTGMWRVTASKDGYVPSYVEVYVRQLSLNPRVEIVLKKVEMDTQAADEASLNILERANLLFKDKRYDEALSLMLQFLEKNPDAYQAYASIADIYREKGDFDQAIENYQKVLEQAATDETLGKEMTARALAGIGESYLKMQDLEKAQAYFKESIEAYPENEILAYNVGEIYFSNQKIDEAIEYFALSTRIKPDWPPPYLKLGYVYLNKGDYADAEKYFTKFLELDPSSPEASTVRNILDYIKKIKQ